VFSTSVYVTGIYCGSLIDRKVALDTPNSEFLLWRDSRSSRTGRNSLLSGLIACLAVIYFLFLFPVFLGWFLESCPVILTLDFDLWSLVRLVYFSGEENLAAGLHLSREILPNG